MASTYTERLRLDMMAYGDHVNSWDEINNKNIGTLLEEAIAGVTEIVMADVTYTLSTENGETDEARKQILHVTGINSATRNIVIPAVQKTYWVHNETSGGHAVQVKTASGTGATIDNGVLRLCYCDGTDVFMVSTGATDEVTLSTDQTILGQKTFVQPVVLNDGSGDGYITTDAAYGTPYAAVHLDADGAVRAVGADNTDGSFTLAIDAPEATGAAEAVLSFTSDVEHLSIRMTADGSLNTIDSDSIPLAVSTPVMVLNGGGGAVISTEWPQVTSYGSFELIPGTGGGFYGSATNNNWVFNISGGNSTRISGLSIGSLGSFTTNVKNDGTLVTIGVDSAATFKIRHTNPQIGDDNYTSTIMQIISGGVPYGTTTLSFSPAGIAADGFVIESDAEFARTRFYAWNGTSTPSIVNIASDTWTFLLSTVELPSGTSVGGSSITEVAQDAVGAMVDTTLVYVDGTPLLTRAALTGDVTAPQGSNTTTIANDAVTFAKMQNINTGKVLGRTTASTGDVEELSAGSGISIASGSISSTITQYTDEMAQDAVGAMVDTTLVYVDGTPLLTRAALTGDVTASQGSNTTTIANDTVTFAKMQNITTDRLLGRDTAGTGDAEEISLNATLEFTGAGAIQRAALTGDVTASAGSNTTTIANDAVTYAKMQNVSATDKILGRQTAGSGDVEEIACTAAGRALIDDATAADQRTTIGLGNVENTALSTWAGSTNITTLGTIGVQFKVRYVGGSGVPTAIFTRNASDVTSVTAGIPTIQIVGANTESTTVEMVAYGSNPTITGWRANGTPGSETAVLTDQTLFGFGCRAWGASAISSAQRALNVFRAAEDWTNTAQGTYWNLNLTQPGTTSTVTKLRIDGYGAFVLGGTDWGTSGMALLSAGTNAPAVWGYPAVANAVPVSDAGGDTTCWVLLGTSQTGNLAPATDGGLTYNATTNALTATTFVGALTGNADTCTTASGVAADSVTNAGLANAAAYTLKGNITGSSDNPTDNTQTQVHTLLSLDGEMLDETRALVFQMTTKPYSGRLHLIDWLIQTLKNAGVWSKLDVFYMFAANDSQAALLNWKNPGTFTATEQSGIAFTSDRGYTGDGVADYVDLSYNPNTQSVGMTQDSAHIGVFILTASATAAPDMGSQNSNTQLRGRTGTDQYRVSSGTTTTASISETFPSHWVAIRRDASNQLLNVNGVNLGSAAVASSAICNSLRVGTAGGGSFSDRQWACAHAGVQLSDADTLALYNAVYEYLAEVGAV